MDLGRAFRDLCALDRVVVEEHEAIEPDVELLRDLAEVLALGAPVDARGGEVLQLDQHLGMIRERIVHDGSVVLAADREEDAPITKAEGRSLELLEGLAGVVVAEVDAGRAVVADDAAPQRVVEVEHEALRGRSQRAAQRAREMAREEGLVRRGHGRPRKRPQTWIRPTRRPRRRHETCVVPDVAAAAFGHALEE